MPWIGMKKLALVHCIDRMLIRRPKVRGLVRPDPEAGPARKHIYQMYGYEKLTVLSYCSRG